MSPIRKLDVYRAVEIESWDDFVQEEIAGMEARGEMDDLPDRGKPINIWRTDVNPEYDLAFSRLKNAGVVPHWMELDKEIAERTEALWTKLDWIEAEIRDLLALLKSPVEPESVPMLSLWQRIAGWFRTDFKNDVPPPPSITSIMATREHERTRFLQLAAELDKRTSTYHDSLPKGAERCRKVPNTCNDCAGSPPAPRPFSIVASP